MLFMYLEEMRALMKKFKKNARKQKKKKAQKAMAAKAAQLKILVKYLDEDYAETKKTLYPMLEDGTCTFDLMWALVSLQLSPKTQNTNDVKVQTQHYCIHLNLWKHRRAKSV
jgi:hypothetical protein